MCEMVQNVSPPVHRTDFIGKPGQVQPDKVMNTLTSIHIFFCAFLHFYIHTNEYVHKIQVAENVFVDQVD